MYKLMSRLFTKTIDIEVTCVYNMRYECSMLNG